MALPSHAHTIHRAVHTNPSWCLVGIASALPLKADIASLPRHVRSVPEPDSCTARTVVGTRRISEHCYPASATQLHFIA
jgi:hypothetical protein